MLTPSSLDARLFIHAQHITGPPQRLALPDACVQVENRPSLLGKPRVLGKKPMLMLPRFDRRLVQHPPHRAAADLFAQRRLGATHQVSKRLPAQGLFRFCDHLARHRLDQRLIQRGKNGLAPASWLVFNGEITGSPATSPAPHLASGQTHLLGRLVVCHVGLLVKQQCQPKALHDLDRHGSAADCVLGHLHETVGESTRGGSWSWHSGVLSVPGFFWEFISFYKKCAVTATLFVKRTT